MSNARPQGVSFTNNLATDLGAGAVRLGRGSGAVQPGECEGHTVADNVLQHGGCKVLYVFPLHLCTAPRAFHASRLSAAGGVPPTRSP